MTNRDGSTSSKAVGPYAVREPDRTPPKIVSGTVANGEDKVNPGSINAAVSGMILMSLLQEVLSCLMALVLLLIGLRM